MPFGRIKTGANSGAGAVFKKASRQTRHIAALCKASYGVEVIIIICSVLEESGSPIEIGYKHCSGN